MRTVLALLFLSVVIATPAAAQVTNVTLFDPSIQSAGMAGATVAAFWQDLPNVWANPALASFQRGIRYSYGTTQLLPSVTEGIYLKSHQILLGAHGIGLEVSGKPVDSLGKIRLDYGLTEITDINGNVIGEINAYEEVRTLAIGVDLVALFASFQEATRGEPSAIRQRLSIAVGHAWKDIVADLGFAAGESEVRDIGALVRVAALDQIGATLGEASTDTRCRLELAGGYSEQNYNEEFSEDLDTYADLTQYGASVRLTVANPTTGEGFLRDFGTPAIAVALAWTQTDEGFGANTNRFGAEGSLWDLIYLRGGYVDDKAGDVHGPSFGGGVSLQYRKAVGARFDYARYPLAEGLRSDLDRFQITAFLDPVRFWREMR